VPSTHCGKSWAASRIGPVAPTAPVVASAAPGATTSRAIAPGRRRATGGPTGAGDISGAFVDVRDGQLHMLVTANAGDVAEPEDRVWTIGFASSRGERRRIALTPLEGPLRESGRVPYWGARLRLDGEPAWLARRDVRWRLTARISRPLGDQTHDGVPDRATFGR
jgi:hypothetical protein